MNLNFIVPSTMQRRLNTLLPWVLLLAYFGLVLPGAIHHESWFDEAQSWLLARDCTPYSLLSQHLRVEGHPPLWHLVIMPLAKLGLPYRFLPVFSALLASVGVTALLFHPRIPNTWKLLVPSSFFISYQYAVVARSYVLLFPLLMGLLWLWPERVKRLRTFLALLVLLSLVSLHGLSLAAGMMAYSLWDPVQRPDWKALPRAKWLELALVALGLLSFLVLILLPPTDLAFRSRVHYLPSYRVLIGQGLDNLTSAVAGDFIWGLLLLPPVFWWLHQRSCLALALTLQVAIFPICAVYFNLWHQGIFVLALLFPLLLAAQETVTFEKALPRRLSQAGATALILLALHQGAGTLRAYEWDLAGPYSGSRRIASLLHQPAARGERIAAMGFSTLAVQPYFKHNLYANYHLPDGGAYWSWQRPTPLFYALSAEIVPSAMAAWAKAQLADRPDWVVVSLKFQSEQIYLKAIEEDGNYLKAAAAPGRMVWKQEEPEEYEQFLLFRRKDSPHSVDGGSNHSGGPGQG